MDNDISWDKEVSLQRLLLPYSSQQERSWFSPVGRGLGNFSLQEKLGRNCREERQMKRASNPTTKLLAVQKRRAGRALRGI